MRTVKRDTYDLGASMTSCWRFYAAYVAAKNYWLHVFALRHQFIFGMPRGVNRKLSNWVKGVAQDRFKFMTKVGGTLLEQVNRAYSSQTCPKCGFVEEKNRKGDRFKCQHPYSWVPGPCG